jgi:hypothetical protein
MIDRQACRCPACRARDGRAFERVVAGLTPTRAAADMSFLWPETESLAARVAAYTYGERRPT